MSDAAAGDGVAVECSRCGSPKDETYTLEAVTDPRDGEVRALCNECHALLVEKRTLLSPQQARILALWTADFGSSEIATVLGMSASNVSTQKGNIRAKKSEAAQQRNRADATLAVLEDVDQ